MQLKRGWRLVGTGGILSLVCGYLFLAGSRYHLFIGYFVYMSVACILIPLPAPPYVMALGKLFHPGPVALVGTLGNCLAASAEYFIIHRFFSKTELRQQVASDATFQRLAPYFQRAAFACLIFTGLMPLPLEPFRLAAILIRYPLPKYLLALFTGRFPRYYLIALMGHRFPIPNRYLMAMLLVLFVTSGIGVKRVSSLKRRRSD